MSQKNVYILAPNSWQGSAEACIAATSMTDDASVNPCHDPGATPIGQAKVTIDLAADRAIDKVVFTIKSCDTNVPADRRTTFAAQQGIYLKVDQSSITQNGQPVASPPPALQQWMNRLDDSVPSSADPTLETWTYTVPPPPQHAGASGYEVHIKFGINYVVYDSHGTSYDVNPDPEMDFEPPA